jgi:lipopolysaccharide/colanic/teichoic acid biosynthesis glycosyltransferase
MSTTEQHTRGVLTLPQQKSAAPAYTAPAPPSKEEIQERFSPTYCDPRIEKRRIPHLHAKRALDILLSLGGILVFAPLGLIIAVIIKATSKGPVIFKQPRVGIGGRYFWCYKFRSMCNDAEKRKSEIAHLNEVDGPVFKIKDDPRITPIGKIIRKTSLDELPQLVNIFKGEMSVVGPRPLPVSEVDVDDARQRQRLTVQPGLTCYWQISGRSDTSFEEWMSLDERYVAETSLATDLKIIAKTIPVVLFGSGAY